jgi:hypothetical protein
MNVKHDRVGRPTTPGTSTALARVLDSQSALAQEELLHGVGHMVDGHISQGQVPHGQW